MEPVPCDEIYYITALLASSYRSLLHFYLVKVKGSPLTSAPQVASHHQGALQLLSFPPPHIEISLYQTHGFSDRTTPDTMPVPGFSLVPTNALPCSCT